MADQNIRDFSVNWVLFGLLIFSMLVFTINFIGNNNPDALTSGEKKNLETVYNNLSNSLFEVQSDTNSQINLSADLGSEESQIGSLAASSTSYGLMGTGTGFWENIKVLFGWVFSGLAGQIILGVFGGLIGISALYFVIKLIRSLF